MLSPQTLTRSSRGTRSKSRQATTSISNHQPSRLSPGTVDKLKLFIHLMLILFLKVRCECKRQSAQEARVDDSNKRRRTHFRGDWHDDRRRCCDGAAPGAEISGAAVGGAEQRLSAQHPAPGDHVVAHDGVSRASQAREQHQSGCHAAAVK